MIGRCARQGNISAGEVDGAACTVVNQLGLGSLLLEKCIIQFYEIDLQDALISIFTVIFLALMITEF